MKNIGTNVQMRKIYITIFVPKYKSLLTKSRKLKKLIVILLLLIITIDFIILSLRERDLVYVFNKVIIVD